MSRELLAFLLSELNTVRLVCRGNYQDRPCGAVLEIGLAELENLYQRVTKCPLCGQSFGVFPHNSGGVARDGFGPLFRAVADLKAVQDRFGLEFVLPAREK